MVKVTSETWMKSITSDWNGAYGIKVYGNAMIEGEAYVLAPYWVATNGEDTVTLDPITDDDDVSKYQFIFGESSQQ